MDPRSVEYCKQTKHCQASHLSYATTLPSALVRACIAVGSGQESETVMSEAREGGREKLDGVSVYILLLRVHCSMHDQGQQIRPVTYKVKNNRNALRTLLWHRSKGP